MQNIPKKDNGKGKVPTKKQKDFVKVYLETGNATEAAMQIYDCKDRVVARAIGTENLAKPLIQQEIQRVERNLHEEFKEKAGVVFDELLRLACSARSEMVRAQACKDLLDRAGFKPADKREISGPGGSPIAYNHLFEGIMQRAKELEQKEQQKAIETTAEEVPYNE